MKTQQNGQFEQIGEDGRRRPERRSPRMRTQASDTNSQYCGLDRRWEVPRKIEWLLEYAIEWFRDEPLALILIPPDSAAWILENCNSRNRKLNAGELYRLRQAREEWSHLRSVIEFDEQGDLFEGQHRLTVAVDEGKDILTLVAFNQSRMIPVAKTLDRRARDQMKISGEAEDLTQQDEALVGIAKRYAGNGKGVTVQSMRHAMTQDWWDIVHDAARWQRAKYVGTALVQYAFCTAVYAGDVALGTAREMYTLWVRNEVPSSKGLAKFYSKCLTEPVDWGAHKASIENLHLLQNLVKRLCVDKGSYTGFRPTRVTENEGRDSLIWQLLPWGSNDV